MRRDKRPADAVAECDCALRLLPRFGRALFRKGASMLEAWASLEAKTGSCTPPGAREDTHSAVFDRIPLCARCMPVFTRCSEDSAPYRSPATRLAYIQHVGLAELARLYAPLYRAAAAPSSRYVPRLNLGSISAQSRLNLGWNISARSRLQSSRRLHSCHSSQVCAPAGAAPAARRRLQLGRACVRGVGRATRRRH